MGARLKAADERNARLHKQVGELQDQNVDLTGKVLELEQQLRDTETSLWAARAARGAARTRAAKAEAKLAAIDAVQHPKKPRDPFENRAQLYGRMDPHRGSLHVGAIVNRETGKRIEVEGTYRDDVLAELKRRDEAETAAWRAANASRPVKPVNDPETGELLGHMIMIEGRWRILNEDDLGHAAALEAYKAKLRVRVEIRGDNDELLAILDRATKRVAKAHEERLEDSLMALGWTPPVSSSAAERRANLLKLSEREAARRPQLWQDAIGNSYWGIVPPCDRLVVKVTG